MCHRRRLDESRSEREPSGTLLNVGLVVAYLFFFNLMN